MKAYSVETFGMQFVGIIENTWPVVAQNSAASRQWSVVLYL